MSAADRAKWDAVYARRTSIGDPSPFLVELADALPITGRALDLAGGAGRNAAFLSARGLDVTLADISESALALARSADPRLRTLQVDLDDGFPPGPWDVLLTLNFLDRRLFAALPDLLAPGGLFVFAQPTVTNLQRHPRPSARFLLEDGELAGLLPQDIDVVRLTEDWFDDRHEARLVARRR